MYPEPETDEVMELGLTRLAHDAAAAAEAAARASGVVVRELHEVSELHRVSDLYGRIWHADPADPPITTPVMRALTHSGNYLAGAFDGTEMVGACVGFLAAPAGRALHSHMAGVAAKVRGRGVGFALKAHQRAWALARGLTTITWTFDPLVARNAYLNLAKLGATSAEYLRDFYGAMDDRINVGDPTDRLLVDWQLDAASVARCCAGEHDEPDIAALRSAVVGLDIRAGRPEPGPADGPIVSDAREPTAGAGQRDYLASGRRSEQSKIVLVRVPTDVERMRVDDPALALKWRYALRDVLGGLIGEGARVTSFAWPGWYVVETALSRTRTEV